MNVAIRPRSNQSDPAASEARPAGHIVRVEVFQDLFAVEPVWRRLERAGTVATPYQRYDLLAAWQRHVGIAKGVTPFIVVGTNEAGVPTFLWPFGKLKRGPLQLLQFLGGKHANFSFGIWRHDAAQAMGVGEIEGVFKQIGREHGIDLVALSRQQVSWEGLANPFALLPHRPSPDDSYRLQLGQTGAAALDRQLGKALKRQLRSKERKLQTLGGYRHLKASMPVDVNRLLDAFFALKSAHLAAQGLRNVFVEPGVQSFLREACHRGLGEGHPILEIHALEGGGEILALFAGTTDGRRFCSMLNSYTLGPHGRHSPGLVLLRHLIADLAQRGHQSFDLGIGAARYKRIFCKEVEPLFDAFLPLTPLGAAAAMAAQTVGSIKRSIKRNPTLWSPLVQLRRAAFGRGPAAV
jgi:CelD/BcsL family acetyltransferase involved in cellulose biosynthesis